MLHLLFRVLSRINRSTEEVVLHARVAETSSDGMDSDVQGKRRRASRTKQNAPAPIDHPAPLRVTHRQRVLSMRLEHTRLCSSRRCDRLQTMGVVTAGDLSSAKLERLAGHFGAPRKALRVLTQYRRAIRFAAAVPGMMPRDAMLLISIHRRSVRGLASETAPALHRDLERFAESTQGQLQLRGRRIPSTRRLKRWIAACEQTLPQRALGRPTLAVSVVERAA
ncbi:MAG: DUF4332 domain-containing protein [Planctomycetota bacterium]